MNCIVSAYCPPAASCWQYGEEAVKIPLSYIFEPLTRLLTASTFFWTLYKKLWTAPVLVFTHPPGPQECQPEIFKALNTKTKPSDFPLQGSDKSNEPSVWQVKGPNNRAANCLPSLYSERPPHSSACFSNTCNFLSKLKWWTGPNSLVTITGNPDRHSQLGIIYSCFPQLRR